jgi:hypothetical protein
MTGEETDRPWTPGNPFDRSVEGFRIRHGTRLGPMSRSFYYGMKRRHQGPAEKHVNGKVIITVEAEAEWDAHTAPPGSTEERLIAKMNAKRHRRAVKAGRRAAKSPRHISKQGPRKRPPRSK